MGNVFTSNSKKSAEKEFKNFYEIMDYIATYKGDFLPGSLRGGVDFSRHSIHPILDGTIQQHLETMKTLIDGMDIKYSCEYYIGGMKQKKLDEASEAQIILGSYGMASEGLDIPALNTLIMATPRREVEQSIGRIIRKNDHTVQPLIIDIVDMLACFVKQGIYRRKLYKKLNYKIEVYEVENSIIVSKIEINTTETTSNAKAETCEFLD